MISTPVKMATRMKPSMLKNLPRQSHRWRRRTRIRSRLTIRRYDGLQVIALSPFLLAVTTGRLRSTGCNLFRLIDGSLFEVSTIHGRVECVGKESDRTRRLGKASPETVWIVVMNGVVGEGGRSCQLPLVVWSEQVRKV